MTAKISASENSKPKKFPLNDDGTLSLSAIKKKNRHITGLRYRDKQTGNLRALSINSGVFQIPMGSSWDDFVFHCVFNEKNAETNLKHSSLAEYYELDTFGMIVMAVPYSVDNDEFYQYFSQFGKLNLCELKKDQTTGRGKGYGFLKFANFDDQLKCINSELLLAGGEMYLRLPTNKLDKSILERMVFVSNITPSVTLVDLLEYFGVFGKICEIFMPPGIVPHAFITFTKEDAVYNTLRFGESHRVFGGFVLVEKILTKQDMEHALSKKCLKESKSQNVEYIIPRDNVIEESASIYPHPPYMESRLNVCSETGSNISRSPIFTPTTSQPLPGQTLSMSESNLIYIPTICTNSGPILQSPRGNFWDFPPPSTQQISDSNSCSYPSLPSELTQPYTSWSVPTHVTIPQFHSMPPNTQDFPLYPHVNTSIPNPSMYCSDQDCGISRGQWQLSQFAQNGYEMQWNGRIAPTMNSNTAFKAYDEVTSVERVADVTGMLLKTCYSQQEKKIMAKRLFDIITEPNHSYGDCNISCADLDAHP